MFQRSRWIMREAWERLTEGRYQDGVRAGQRLVSKAERERDTLDRHVSDFVETMAELLGCSAVSGSIRGAVERLIEERDELAEAHENAQHIAWEADGWE